MVKSDLEIIGEFMAKRRNVYLCAGCLSAELPMIGKDRVNAAFAELNRDGYRHPAIWCETSECDHCGRREPAVIVH